MSGWVVRSSSASLMPSSVFVGGIEMSASTTSGTTSSIVARSESKSRARGDDLDVLRRPRGLGGSPRGRCSCPLRTPREWSRHGTSHGSLVARRDPRTRSARSPHPFRMMWLNRRSRSVTTRSTRSRPSSPVRDQEHGATARRPRTRRAGARTRWLGRGGRSARRAPAPARRPAGLARATSRCRWPPESARPCLADERVQAVRERSRSSPRSGRGAAPARPPRRSRSGRGRRTLSRMLAEKRCDSWPATEIARRTSARA